MDIDGRQMEINPAMEEASSRNADGDEARRTGSLSSATAHIITAVIGSGVLSLPWATAQLGWVAGPIILVIFAVISTYTSSLLADCYRYPGPVEGTRNQTYISAVRAHLSGGIKFKLCGLSQYINLTGTTVGYTLTSGISMAAIKRSNCFHEKGHDAGCHTSNSQYLIIFGAIQIILCQIRNFHKLAGLSTIAAIMSFAYSSIGLGLSLAKIARGNNHVTTSLGVDVTTSEKFWNMLEALGNIAFAYTFFPLLIEIQDTLKPTPPENQVMKKASIIGIGVTTVLYTLSGTLGYAAFGNKAQGNFLTGFGFYEPFWLVDIGNLCIVVHLLGAYQVYCQPMFKFVEDWCSRKWPRSDLITKEYPVTLPSGGVCSVNLFRLTWRTAYVMVTTLIAMIFPVFNSVLGLLGALSFWPLSMYFPIEMYITQAKVRRFSFSWTMLQALSMFGLVVAVLAAAGSIQGIITAFNSFKPLHSVS